MATSKIPRVSMLYFRNNGICYFLKYQVKIGQPKSFTIIITFTYDSTFDTEIIKKSFLKRILHFYNLGQKSVLKSSFGLCMIKNELLVPYFQISCCYKSFYLVLGHMTPLQQPGVVEVQGAAT